MAIEPAIILAVGKSSQPKLRLVNANAAKYPDYEADKVDIDGSHPFWWNYFLCGVKGVNPKGPISMNCMVSGSIPPASGLSSSSALVVSAALAAYAIEGQIQAQERSAVADLCARAERFIGTQGGGMDQAIELLAVEGRAQFIQFNPLRTTPVSLPKGACFVIANSLAEANKAAGSEFNQRVVECRLATKVLGRILGLQDQASRLIQVQEQSGKSLSQLIELVNDKLHVEPYTKSELLELLGISQEDMDSSILTPNTVGMTSFKLHQRAQHVFSEAFRVEEYQRICGEGQSLQMLGALMFQSHQSCSRMYECSHPALDRLVEISQAEGAYGARLTGAGWGGCIVSLVAQDKVESYIQAMLDQYYANVTIPPGLQVHEYIFPTKPGPGAQIFDYVL